MGSTSSRHSDRTTLSNRSPVDPQSHASDDEHHTLAPNCSAAGSTLTFTEFVWNFSAHSVYVTGAWDDWREKTPLAPSAQNAFSATLSLPAGTFQYKFVVDGSWKHNPALPTQQDQNGNMNNFVVVTPQTAEFDAEVVGTMVDEPQARSPADSYNFSIFPQEDHNTEPPIMPRVLTVAPMDCAHGGRGADVGMDFVRLNHIFSTTCDAGYGRDGAVVTLSAETRFKSKVVTTILVSSRCSS